MPLRLIKIFSFFLLTCLAIFLVCLHACVSVCACMHACVSVYATSCMLECLCGGQKNNPWELVLSFHPEVPGINLRLSGSLAKCLYLLRCLTCLRLLFWHWLTSCFKTLFSGKILKIKIPGFLEVSSLLNLCQGMSEGRTSCSLPSRLFNLPRKHWVNWNQASAIQWYQLVCLLGSCLPACFELRRSGYWAISILISDCQWASLCSLGLGWSEFSFLVQF